MQRRVFLGLLVGLLPLPVLAQQAPQPAMPDPQATVKMFYNPKIKEERRPISRALDDLYKAAAKKSIERDEPGNALNFDPTTGSQDYDDDFRKTLRYKTISQDATKAVVEVSVRVFKTEKPVTLTYELVFERNTWRVNDIANRAKGEEGWSLAAMLIEDIKAD